MLCESTLPGVSILKPLKGSDPGLRENLQTFFCLDYPKFEIVFSASSKTDPSLVVVRALMREYPEVQASLVISQDTEWTNPKVENLKASTPLARYDWLLISDSNTRVHSQALRRLMTEVEEGVGVITSSIVGEGMQTWVSHIEAGYFRTYFSRWMILSAFFGRAFVVGKSMLFRKSVAEKFGGIRALESYLAEDYMAGFAMKQLGLRIKVSRFPVVQYMGAQSLSHFWRRHLRWARIRKAHLPIAFWLEPFSTSWVAFGVGYIGLSKLNFVSLGAFAWIHFGLWFLGEFLLSRKLGGFTLSVWDFFHFLWTTPAREFFLLAVFVHASVGNAVVWRGQRLYLKRGGLISAQV